MIGATVVTSFGKSIGPVHFSHFQCSGNEAFLLNCTYSIQLCDNFEYHAGVKCEGTYSTIKAMIFCL